MNPHSGSERTFGFATRTLLQGFLQLIYPGTCWVCGKLVSERVPLICTACADELTHDAHSTCPRCSSTVGPFVALEQGCPACRGQSLAFDQAVRMGPYEGLLRDAILRMKSPAGEDLAEAIGALWAQRLVPRLQACAIDVVVPVPLHWVRRWQRGFNQSEILAQAAARTLRVPCDSRVLRCTRRTGQQKLLTATERRANVRNAFQVARGHVAGKTVLLVDDVMTTGATAHEAARALRRGRATQTVVAVLAHGR